MMESPYGIDGATESRRSSRRSRILYRTHTADFCLWFVTQAYQRRPCRIAGAGSTMWVAHFR